MNRWHHRFTTPRVSAERERGQPVSTQLTWDIRRAALVLGGAVLLLLAALTAIAMLLFWDARARLAPLHEQADMLAETQQQLLDYLVVQQNWLDLRTGAAEEVTEIEIETRDSVLQSMESVVQLVDSTLENLRTAQSDSTNLITATAIGITLLVLALVALGMVAQKRILKPIGTLEDLLRRLAREDYQPAPLEDVDDVIRPTFESYNRLVGRLARLEKANQARHERMETQVSEATRTLVAQRADLARVERLAAVGEIAASVAHEVRNPLAAIRAACRSLIEDTGEADTRERLGMIDEEVNHLLDIVNRQLRRARHRPEEPQPTDLTRLVRNLVRLMEYQTPDAIALRMALPGSLCARLPPNGLRQALLNLIKNSIEALEGRSGVIDIATVERGKTIEIEVKDNGQGFPEEMLAKSMHRFVTGKRDGTGLGLAMVERYARDQGGKLEIENRADEGACVRIVLPWRHCEEPAPGKDRETTSSA